jgi:hypothetical protein
VSILTLGASVKCALRHARHVLELRQRVSRVTIQQLVQLRRRSTAKRSCSMEHVHRRAITLDTSRTTSLVLQQVGSVFSARSVPSVHLLQPAVKLSRFSCSLLSLFAHRYRIHCALRGQRAQMERLKLLRHH